MLYQKMNGNTPYLSFCTRNIWIAYKCSSRGLRHGIDVIVILTMSDCCHAYNQALQCPQQALTLHGIHSCRASKPYYTQYKIFFPKCMSVQYKRHLRTVLHYSCSRQYRVRVLGTIQYSYVLYCTEYYSSTVLVQYSYCVRRVPSKILVPYNYWVVMSAEGDF